MVLRRIVTATLGILCLIGIDISAVVGDEVKKTTAKQTSAFRLFRKLEGDWSGKASHGDVHFDSKVNYRITPAGSAAVETLCGGTDHEMITMYHQNGDGLLLTDYCAAGNQPRMKAQKTANPQKIEFKFLDGTNLDPSNDMHMHEMTIEFVDDDHVKTEWMTSVDGKAKDRARFDLARVKNAE